jgi:Spy/CpxP family protein refolding chaperone
MGLSFWYHKQQDKKAAQAPKIEVKVPTEQRTRFFKEQLNLSLEQVNDFRNINRTYNQNARKISYDLQNLRIKMVNELNQDSPNQQLLNNIATEIGNLHTQLKNLTIEFYLNLKQTCTAEQQKQLNQIFVSILSAKEDIKLPRQGPKGWGRKNRD